MNYNLPSFNQNSLRNKLYNRQHSATHTRTLTLTPLISTSTNAKDMMMTHGLKIRLVTQPQADTMQERATPVWWLITKEYRILVRNLGTGERMACLVVSVIRAKFIIKCMLINYDSGKSDMINVLLWFKYMLWVIILIDFRYIYWKINKFKSQNSLVLHKYLHDLP